MNNISDPDTRKAMHLALNCRGLWTSFVRVYIFDNPQVFEFQMLLLMVISKFQPHIIWFPDKTVNQKLDDLHKKRYKKKMKLAELALSKSG